MTDFIQVVAGIVYNENGDVLLTSRPKNKAYAGYWEFAGGKIEQGESTFSALQREFKEELGIEIHIARPWLKKRHIYEHAAVELQFFRIEANDWTGEIQACEQQNWSWQRIGHYDVTPMLPANADLLAALIIPDNLTGNLTSGFLGKNRANDDYRIVPYRDAQSSDQAILINTADLSEFKLLNKKQKIWIEITDECQLTPIADAVLWRIDSVMAANKLSSILQQRLAVPVLVYTPHAICEQFAVQWLALGVHGIIENKEILMV